MLKRHWCIVLPLLCLSRAWPHSNKPMAVHVWVPTAAHSRHQPPNCPVLSASLPCCGCPGAGGCGHTGRQDSFQMRETRGNHVCDGELLIPVTMAGGAWGVCPHGPQLDLPGSSTSSPQLWWARSLPCLQACPAAPVVLERPHMCWEHEQCPAGPAGFSSPMAAGEAMTAKRCHFLQLGFYRVGGRGAFIELCLHFWSFLRDTFSHERPAWSQLLHGGLWG